MAFLSLKNIDDIDDLEDIIEVFKALGISSKGFASLDLMKARVRERLSQLPERTAWSNGQVRLLFNNFSPDHRHLMNDRSLPAYDAKPLCKKVQSYGVMGLKL